MIYFQINLSVHDPTRPESRPHSYPFVTGDTLRAFADVVFENTEPLFKPWYFKYIKWYYKITMSIIMHTSHPINLFIGG